MFTGIIESVGHIERLEKDQGNLNIWMKSALASDLKIDQSVSHNGICLTVVFISDNSYKVTAINETIEKTSISSWAEGDLINLERGMKLDQRLDGHIVQGHVDQTGICKSIVDDNGSWYFTFQYESSIGNVTIEKGSITVNGVSLTVVNSKVGEFSVAIIPYTLNHTTFKDLKLGSIVNLEFDVIGKYVARLMTVQL